MNLWGKIIGSLVGYLLLGGPWGFLFGLLIGHFIDQGFTLFQVATFTKFSARELESIAPEFFTALFSVMGFISKADGKDPADAGPVLNIMNTMGIPMEYKNDVVQLYRGGYSPDYSMHRMVGQLYIDCQEHSKLFEIFVELLLLAAMTDGKLSPIEKQNIQTVCFQLDLSSADFARMQRLVLSVARKMTKHNKKAQKAEKGTHQNTESTRKAKSRSEKRREKQTKYSRRSDASEKRNLETAFAILNVAQTATNDDIKQAYRRLTSRHHPDKLVAKGMPDEVLKMAEVRTREIRMAYDHIRAVRNF